MLTFNLCLTFLWWWYLHFLVFALRIGSAAFSHHQNNLLHTYYFIVLLQLLFYFNFISYSPSSYSLLSFMPHASRMSNTELLFSVFIVFLKYLLRTVPTSRISNTELLFWYSFSYLSISCVQYRYLVYQFRSYFLGIHLRL